MYSKSRLDFSKYELLPVREIELSNRKDFRNRLLERANNHWSNTKLTFRYIN